MSLNKVKKFFQKKNTFNSLLTAVCQRDVKRIRTIVVDFNEVDLANWMSMISSDDQIFFMRSLDNLTSSAVLNNLSPEVIKNIISAFNKKETRELLSTLYSDDILELVEDLPSDLVTKILESSSKEQREDINYILNYQEGTVGYEMNVDFFSIKINSRISDVFEHIKKSKKNVDDIQFYYVIDHSGTLIGYVSLPELIACQETKTDKLVSAIMETDVVSVRASDPTEKAVQKVQKYNLAQLPVVDLQNKLVGILTIEESLQMLKEEYVDDFNKQAGVVQSSDKKYFELSVWENFTSRFKWLFITILVTTFSQIIFSFLLFDFNVSDVKLLWFKFILPFVPFILTIVGNIALQSSALVVKGLVLKEIGKREYSKVLKKEILVSFLILIFILVFNIPRTWIINLIVHQKIWFDVFFWKNLGQVTILICISVFFAVFFAAGLPIFADYFGFDPSLMSSPLLTTIVDLLVTGVAVGFSYVIYILLT